MSFLRLFVVSLTLLLAMAAAAKTTATLEQIYTRQQAIKARIDAGQAKDLNSEQVQAIRERQRLVFALIEGRHSLDELSRKDSRQLDKALEGITNLLTTGDAVAEECWQDKSIGTRVGQRRCGKRADRHATDERAREWLERSSSL